jgi:hypothetical protein
MGAEMSVKVTDLRVSLVTVLHRTQERLVTTVGKHVLPKLLNVRHGHPACQMVFVLLHMGALNDLVRLRPVLSREHVE